jgi:DMSO/TMAO reductase YedYZ molybdopterin-dependent catalytic subunit
MVGNATWAGAELQSLLKEAQPGRDAREVYFWGADRGVEKIRNADFEENFARSLPFDVASTANAILAYEMNGRPLPVIHGFPVRLVVPGYYGVCNVKWIERIEFAADRLMMRFMARDYVTIMGREVNGRTEWIETSVTKMRPKSVIAKVTRLGPQFKVFGAAWTDGTPVQSVDVQVDGGAWRPATLDRRNDPFAWTFWSYETAGLVVGEHTLASRATDQRGRTQPDNLDMKKTNWENNELFFRKIVVS